MMTTATKSRKNASSSSSFARPFILGGPLHRIQSAPVSRQDIITGDEAEIFGKDDEEEEENEILLENFENCWKEFIKEHPLECASYKRILQLQKEVKDEKESASVVEKELQKQVEFFRNAREEQEERYQKEIAEAVQHKKRVEAELNDKLDKVAQSLQIQPKTLQWHHFLRTLDELAVSETTTPSGEGDSDEPDEEEQASAVISSMPIAKPSARAMLLTDTTIGDPEHDVQLRANRIDNNLLKTNVRMIEQEIADLERVTPVTEELGNFLQEQNIWELLGCGEQAAAASAAAAAAVSSRRGSSQKPSSS